MSVTSKVASVGADGKSILSSILGSHDIKLNNARPKSDTIIFFVIFINLSFLISRILS